MKLGLTKCSASVFFSGKSGKSLHDDGITESEVDRTVIEQVLKELWRLIGPALLPLLKHS